MPTVFDINPNELIEKVAEALKKDVVMPEWAKFVKTSTGKERPPDRTDWYFYRAASILRKVYKDGPVGTNKLRLKYGSKKNRGHKREEFRRASGKIIRSILQQLEKNGYVKKDKKGNFSGRVITPKGKSFLDKMVRRNDGRGSGKDSKHVERAAEKATGVAAAS